MRNAEIDAVVRGVEAEQYLALNAYLCFCSAVGCFQGAMHARAMFCLWIDEMFYMGFAFSACGFVLLALADFKIPSTVLLIWARRVRVIWSN